MRFIGERRRDEDQKQRRRYKEKKKGELTESLDVVLSKASLHQGKIPGSIPALLPIALAAHSPRANRNARHLLEALARRDAR